MMGKYETQRTNRRHPLRMLLGTACLVSLVGCGGGDDATAVAVVPGTATNSAAATFTQQIGPTLALIPFVGQSATVNPGTYLGAESVTGQWFADGIAINGATSTSYRITAAEDNKALSYRETAVRSGTTPLVTTLIAPTTIMPALMGSLLAEGDSVLAGIGASSSSKSWINLFSNTLGLSLTNRAVAGYGLEDEFAGGTISADKLLRDAVSVRYNHVLIAIGGNDVLQTPKSGALSSSNFARQLAARISLLRLAGYAPTDLILTSLYPAGNEALTSSGVSRSTYEAFNAVIRPIAEEYGIRFVDFYSISGGTGDAALVSTDGLHPNDAGYERLYQFAISRTTIPNRRGLPTALTSAALSGGQMNISWSAAAGSPVGYTVDIGMLGDYRFSGNYETSDTSIKLVRLAPGTYRTRVRARYGDGSRGPWQYDTQEAAVR